MMMMFTLKMMMMMTVFQDRMRMLMKLLDGKNMSERDFLDLVNSQFGEAGKAELERLLKSGMTMQVG